MTLSKQIHAVIFDMDGLLIDSEPYWHETTEAFFAKYDKPFHPQIHRYIRGRGLRDIIEYFKKEHGFVGETDALIEERKEMLYEQLLPHISLMTGAEKLIKTLAKKKIPMAIATSGHSRRRTKEILAKFGLVDLFSVFVSGEDVKKSKPDPEIYMKAAELLHIDPKHCLVLEDAPNGALSGKAAGMYIIGVNTEEWLIESLEKSGADHVIKTLMEISV